MRGRTLPPTVTNVNWSAPSSYVQINIYDTNLEGLRERGVDMKSILQSIGCRSIVMDVPILLPGVKESPVVLDGRRAKSLAYTVPMSKMTRSLVEAPACMVTAVHGRGRRSKNDRTTPSPEPTFCDNVHSISGDGPTFNASYRIDGESHDTMCAENLETLSANQALEKTTLPKNSPITEAIEEAALKTMEPCMESFSEPIFQDILEEDCSLSRVISDGLKGIDSEWPPTIIPHESSPIVKAEETFDMIEKGCAKIFTEAEAPSCDLIPPHGNATSASSIQADAMKNGSVLEEALDHLSKSEITSRGDDFEMNSEEGEKKQRTAPRKTSGCSRKRARKSSRESQKSNDILQNSNKNNANQLKSLLKDGQESTVFECSMLGCSSKLKWHPRVGRNRLVDHVRTHWNKDTKKCKLCDFTAKTARKIHHHHMQVHPNEAFMGAQSNETDEDLKELQRLYLQCFPDIIEDQFYIGKLPLIGVRTPHTRRLLAFAKKGKAFVEHH